MSRNVRRTVRWRRSHYHVVPYVNPRAFPGMFGRSIGRNMLRGWLEDDLDWCFLHSFLPWVSNRCFSVSYRESTTYEHLPFGLWKWDYRITRQDMMWDGNTSRAFKRLEAASHWDLLNPAFGPSIIHTHTLSLFHPSTTLAAFCYWLPSEPHWYPYSRTGRVISESFPTRSAQRPAATIIIHFVLPKFAFFISCCFLDCVGLRIYSYIGIGTSEESNL